jgi:hypothetical protein
MSEPRTAGPLPAFASAIADEAAKHQALPPDKKNANRAYVGAFLLGICVYLAFTLDPGDYPGEKLGFLAICAWGLFLLVVGWRGSRGARNPVGAVFALAVPAGGFIAVANYRPELFNNFYVQAFCTGVVTANLVRFLIDIRGPGGDAQKIVHRQISQNEINWQSVKRRR